MKATALPSQRVQSGGGLCYGGEGRGCGIHGGDHQELFRR